MNSYPNLGYVAIVEADAGDYTFAHEVGHLMGARHDTDTQTNIPNLSNTAHGHSWFYRNWFWGSKHYQKSMVASGPTVGSRVMYYSNPAVKAHSKARDYTGTSTRNNYVQLKNAACIVSDYNSFEEMTVGMQGPYTVLKYTSFTLTATVSNCSSATYQWETSTDGFNYYNAGTATSYQGFIYDGDMLYVRLTVNCSDGQTKTAYRTITVTGGMYYVKEAPSKKDVINDLNSTILNNATKGVLHAYPNPVSSILNLSTNFSSSKKITVSLYDILSSGKIHLIYNKRIDKGNIETSINVSKMNQGLYQLVIKEGNSVLYDQKLLISR